MKRSRWTSFLGGTDTLFTVSLLILIGVFFLIYRQLDFIFNPLIVILSSILMPIIVSLLLYYLFDPIINFMESHKIKRIWGIVILYIGVVILIVGAAVALYPVLADQVTNLVEAFPTFINNLFDSVINFANNLFPNTAIQDMITRAEDFVTNFFSNFANIASETFSGLSSVISGITSFVFTVVISPIILFFLLKDDNKMLDGFLKILPPKWRPDFLKMGVQINEQVGAYIKGQLLVAIANGLLMFIGFFLIDLNYSGILGIAGGVLSIIPYLGPTLTFIPAVIVALMDSWFKVLLLIGVWLIVQFIEGNFIEPNVMGRQLKVHPLTIIIILIIMGDLLGIFGLIFGIPIYAIIKVIISHFFQKFKQRYNEHYGDIAGEYSVDTVEGWDFGDDNIENAKNKHIKRVAENQDEDD